MSKSDHAYTGDEAEGTWDSVKDTPRRNPPVRLSTGDPLNVLVRKVLGWSGPRSRRQPARVRS